MGKWKGLRLRLSQTDNVPVELYDLEADVGEKNNVAAKHPEVVKRIRQLMSSARTDSEHFPLPD